MIRQNVEKTSIEQATQTKDFFGFQMAKSSSRRKNTDVSLAQIVFDDSMQTSSSVVTSCDFGEWTWYQKYFCPNSEIERL